VYGPGHGRLATSSAAAHDLRSGRLMYKYIPNSNFKLPSWTKHLRSSVQGSSRLLVETLGILEDRLA
jgi:hypothetical protein